MSCVGVSLHLTIFHRCDLFYYVTTTNMLRCAQHVSVCNTRLKIGEVVILFNEPEPRTLERSWLANVNRRLERRHHNLLGTKVIPWLPTNLCSRSTFDNICLLHSTNGSKPSFAGTPGIDGRAARFVSQFEDMATCDDIVDL